MNKSLITELINNANDLDLILIYLFNEPHQFMKKNIKYDVHNDGKTLAIHTLHNHKDYLFNINSIKLMSTLSEKEYQAYYPRHNGVIAE